MRWEIMADKGGRRPKYSDEVRAEAMGRLAAGEAVRTVANDLGVGRETVRRWYDQVRGVVNHAVEQTDRSGRPSLGDLICDYLQASLRALAVQSELYADREWLRAQTAADLAVLTGVLADKTARVLQALSDSSEDIDLDPGIPGQSGLRVLPPPALEQSG